MSSLRWEAALITKVADDGDLKTAVKLGITPDDFIDDESRRIWGYLLRHYSDPKKGGTPSLKYIKSRFPGFEAHRVSDNMGSVIERVKEARLYADLRKLLEDVKDAAQKEDSFAAFDKMKSRVLELTSRTRKEEILDATRLGQSLRHEYEEAKLLKGITGMPLPWACMTEDTGGLKGGEMMGLLGRPGSMKTWALLAVAAHWHSLGYKPLVLTKEMTPQALTRRLVSIYAKVDYRLLRRGKLPTKEERDFFDNLEAWAESIPFHVGYIRSTGPESIVEMQSLVEDLEPDALLIDGMYFLGQRDWQVTALVTSALKDLLIRWNIPCVYNSQLNQDSEKNKKSYESAGGGAYGDSFAQDSDAIYKLRYTPEDRQAGEIAMFCGKLREDSGRHFTFRARPGVDLSQRAVISEGWEGNGDEASSNSTPAGSDEEIVS